MLFNNITQYIINDTKYNVQITHTLNTLFYFAHICHG